MEGSRSESLSFAIALIVAIALAVGFVAYARWATPMVPLNAVESPSPAPRVQAPIASHSQDLPGTRKAPVIAAVYECDVANQKIFSDHACSEGAQIREVNAPNEMRATRIAAPRAAVDHSSADRTVQQAGRAEAPARSKDAVCKSIDQQIDLINARMRNRYTTPEGEMYRERLRRLDDERWDAKCRIR